MKELTFTVPIGTNENETETKVELLKTNGIAEKVFLTKLKEKPYTWLGQIISVSAKTINGVACAEEVRKKYVDNETLTIPDVVLDLPLAVANSMVTEIHRRVWKSKFKDQKFPCYECGRSLTTDIDLDKIEYSEKDLELLAEKKDWSTIDIDIDGGYTYRALPIKDSETGEKVEENLDGVVFNRFRFRVPTLRDLIGKEKYLSDEIVFWRHIAALTIQRGYAVDEKGQVVYELPSKIFGYFGLNFFNEQLEGPDLSTIRKKLRTGIPTISFVYYDVCGCEKMKQIPVTMEGDNFFGE